MALTKITGKDFKEAVDWLLKEKQGCVHQVLGRTDEGTELCLVIGWADIGHDLEEVKKNGYEDEGYYICSKIGYQHRNNGMQSDFEWDFPMPYNPETGDVWDTDTYVAKGDEQSWQTDADMYNEEAEEIWATWGVPNEDGQTTLDIMESKKGSRKCGSKKSEEKKHTCSMQKKKESLAAKKSEAASDTIRVTDEDVMLAVNEVDVDEHGGSFSVDTPEKGKSYDLREMKDMVTVMCEDCSGYSETSRDGSDVRIAVKAPEYDEGGEFNGDYYNAFVMRCTARIVHASLEGVVDYLAED